MVCQCDWIIKYKSSEKKYLKNYIFEKWDRAFKYEALNLKLSLLI